MPYDPAEPLEFTAPMPTGGGGGFDLTGVLGALGIGLSGMAGPYGQNPLLSAALMRQQAERQSSQGFREGAQILSWASQQSGGDPAKEMRLMNEALQNSQFSPATLKMITARMASLEGPARQAMMQEKEKATMTGWFGQPSPPGVPSTGLGGPARLRDVQGPPTPLDEFAQPGAEALAPQPAPAAPLAPTAAPFRSLEQFVQYAIGRPGMTVERATQQGKSLGYQSEQSIPYEVNKFRSMTGPEVERSTATKQAGMDVEAENFSRTLGQEVERSTATKQAGMDVEAENFSRTLGQQEQTATAQAAGRTAEELGPQATQLRGIKAAERTAEELGPQATQLRGIKAAEGLRDFQERERWQGAERQTQAFNMAADVPLQELLQRNARDFSAATSQGNVKAQKDLADYREQLIGRRPPALSETQIKAAFQPIETANVAMTESRVMRGHIIRADAKRLLPQSETRPESWRAQAKQWWNSKDVDLQMVQQLVLPYFIGLVDRGLNDEKGTRAMAIFMKQLELANNMPMKKTFDTLFDLTEYMFSKKVFDSHARHKLLADRPGSRVPRELVEEEERQIQRLFPKGLPPDPSLKFEIEEPPQGFVPIVR
jgi:hypothetical protein